jgi:hypothetical protein
MKANFKNKKNILLSSALLAIMPISILPDQAGAEVTTLTAQAVIGVGIGASFTTNLHFGYLSTNGTASGTVTLNPNTAARATTGTLNLSGSGANQFAVLRVNAVPSAAITITVTAMPVLKHSITTSKTMSVDRFDIRDTTAATTQALTSVGTITFNMPTFTTVNNFNVGGRLVKASGLSLPSGTYKSASVTFNVDYQ